MSIKNHPKCMHGLVARDELYDAIDCLASKIEQCRTAGMSNSEISSKLSEYHECHVHYPLIILSGNL